MLPSSVLDLTKQISKKIIQQLIDEIMKRNNCEMEHRHYTQQNARMPQRTILRIPNCVIPNSDIDNSNTIMYRNQIPKNIAHEQHSHTFPNTFNDQLIISDKTHEDVAIPAPAMTANDIDVSSNKVLQNHKSHKVTSIEQLVLNQPQTSVELNPNVSEEDTMSMSAPNFKPCTSVNKHYNTDTENIKKCECNPNCNNMCNNQIRYAKSSQRKLMCSIKGCNKLFDYKSQLESHIRSHTGEKPFVCTKCGIGFTQSNNLKTHIRSHTGEKPYVCTKCGKKFSRSDKLKLHIRTHTGEKPYVCTKCGKRFKQSSHLQKHIRSHTGEKPYVCTECGKGLSTSGNLKIHMRSHTGEKPYHCTECGKGFSHIGNLNRHNRTQHG